MAAKERKWEISDAEFERQYRAATRRGQAELTKGAYAVAARYDKATRRVAIDLASGLTLLVPTRLIQGLQQASAKDLAEIELLGAGSGLYWPKLGVDTGVAGLLMGTFGTAAWMSQLERADRQSTATAHRASSPASRQRSRPARPKAPGRKPRRAA